MSLGLDKVDRMWKLLGVIFITQGLLDIPWVLLNKDPPASLGLFGLYKGRVNGSISDPRAVGIIWLVILLSTSLLLTYIISRATSWKVALLSGMFVGFTTYFMFNGTSLVMFRDWDWKVALFDTLWGVVLMGIASLVGHYYYHVPVTFDPAKVHPAAL